MNNTKKRIMNWSNILDLEKNDPSFSNKLSCLLESQNTYQEGNTKSSVSHECVSAQQFS